MNKLLENKKYFTLKYKNEFILTIVFELIYGYSNSILIALSFLLIIYIVNRFIVRFNIKDIPFYIIMIYIIIGKILFIIIKGINT